MKRKRSTRTKTTTKRRTRRSRVSRTVRRAGRRIKRSTRKHGKSMITTVTNILPVIESTQLLSENQVAGAGDSAELKAKAVLNGITGSMFDFNLFKDVPQAHFNPSIEGAFNKWTIANVGMIIAGSVGQKFKLKHSSKIKNAGAKGVIPTLIAGILGKNNTVKQDTFRSGSSIVQTSTISQGSGVSPIA